MYGWKHVAHHPHNHSSKATQRQQPVSGPRTLAGLCKAHSFYLQNGKLFPIERGCNLLDVLPLHNNITRRIQQQNSKYHSRAQDDKCKHKIHIQKQKLNKGQKFTVTRLTSTKEFLLKMTEMPVNLFLFNIEDSPVVSVYIPT